MTSEQWAWTVVSLLGIALYFALTWAFELKWILGFRTRRVAVLQAENDELTDANDEHNRRLISISQRIQRMERSRDALPMPNREDSGAN